MTLTTSGILGRIWKPVSNRIVLILNIHLTLQKVLLYQYPLSICKMNDNIKSDVNSIDFISVAFIQCS
jgi:hypothetical protein